MSAVEVNQQREGVCRELAHLGIALSRSLCIPARIVVGYLHELEPMDFHAWFEAYVGGRWYTFDATQAVPRGGRVAVAYGRDAADVAIFNVGRLAREMKEPRLNTLVSVAHSLHQNYYEDAMPEELIQHNIEDMKDILARAL